jgi:predicted amidohydrolase
MLVKIALVQHQVGSPVGLDLKLHLFRKQPDIICFPEYWGATAALSSPEDLAQAWDHHKATMARLSSELSCTVVGGTGVVRGAEGLHNVAPVFDTGQCLGEYRKRHPTERELSRGIQPGSGYQVWAVGPMKMAVAICADCLKPEVFDDYAAAQTDLIFVPNASPHRPGESISDKFRRDDEIFVAGAKRSGAYVIKVCGVGALFGGRLQGRSLVASPWGVLHRVSPEEEDRTLVITVTLSLDELHEFRARFAHTMATSPAETSSL